MKTEMQTSRPIPIVNEFPDATSEREWQALAENVARIFLDAQRMGEKGGNVLNNRNNL